MPLIPKLRVPLEVSGTGFRTVEQDSDEEIAACVYALLATPRGSRLEEPDYGIEDPSFEQLPLEAAETEWLDQISAWEPRAAVKTSQEIEELVDNIVVEVGAR
jgi:phage baseplate assembly protein W